MAMPMPMPHDTHDEPRAAAEPPSGTRTNRTPSGRSSADEEAMRLMVKVFERAQVAKSFAKLASGLLTVTAAQASQQLRIVADAKLAEMKRVAQAARDAAVHVATHRPEAEE